VYIYFHNVCTVYTVQVDIPLKQAQPMM